MTSARPAPDVDTALVLGMASTALPFAGSREEQAERWLRILRMYGDSGAILQRLGVSEGPLEAGEQPPGQASDVAGSEEEVLAAVGEGATRAAESRGAQAVSPADVLVAVMDLYGEDFDRVLRVHGTDRAEVLDRLQSSRAA